MIKFLGKVATEMKKVSWPTFNELVRKTVIVIVVVGIVSLAIIRYVF